MRVFSPGLGRPVREVAHPAVGFFFGVRWGHFTFPFQIIQADCNVKSLVFTPL
jgi:hypothetical protein